MSYDVSYLPQAEQDLIEILAYGIENWGEKLAESMYLKITRTARNPLLFAKSHQKKGQSSNKRNAYF